MVHLGASAPRGPHCEVDGQPSRRLREDDGFARRTLLRAEGTSEMAAYDLKTLLRSPAKGESYDRLRQKTGSPACVVNVSSRDDELKSIHR